MMSRMRGVLPNRPTWWWAWRFSGLGIFLAGLAIMQLWGASVPVRLAGLAVVGALFLGAILGTERRWRKTQQNA